MARCLRRRARLALNRFRMWPAGRFLMAPAGRVGRTGQTVVSERPHVWRVGSFRGRVQDRADYSRQKITGDVTGGSDQQSAEKSRAVTMASASTSIGKELWSGSGPQALTL